MEPKKMGQFIKTLRKERELTQEQLAEALFVSGKTVSRWETGNQLPDLMMLQNVADFFGVEVRELIDGERLPEEVREKSGLQEKETVRKMSEYSDTKEKKSTRRLWIAFGLILVAIGAAVGVLTLKHHRDEMNREQKLQVKGEVTHYSERDDGRVELVLLCDEVQTVRLLLTPETKIGSTELKTRLDAREKGLILAAESLYTKGAEQAAKKKGEEYVYPMTELSYAVQPAIPYAPAVEGGSGLRPLEELLENYTLAQAEADGCVVMEGKTLLHGQQRWQNFVKLTGEGKPSAIRIFSYSSPYNPDYSLKELVYNGEKFRLKAYEKEYVYDEKKGETVFGGWRFREDTYLYLKEDDIVRYEYHAMSYLLTNDPTADYDGYWELLRSGSTQEESLQYGMLLIEWDLSEPPVMDRSLYENGLEFSDIDGDGQEEKCYLGHGITSGLFTFIVEAYGEKDGRRYSTLFCSDYMKLQFVRENGELCVKGIKPEDTWTKTPEETHVYHIVIRDGVLRLEENGEMLEGLELTYEGIR